MIGTMGLLVCGQGLSVGSMVDLHADDGVDEEEHGDEQDDIGERLEGLHEGPE